MTRKARHDGNCTIYAALANGNPEDGICTCGYARGRKGEGDYITSLYSPELLKKLEKESKGIIRNSSNLIRKMLKGAGE